MSLSVPISIGDIDNHSSSSSSSTRTSVNLDNLTQINATIVTLLNRNSIVLNYI